DGTRILAIHHGGAACRARRHPVRRRRGLGPARALQGLARAGQISDQRRALVFVWRRPADRPLQEGAVQALAGPLGRDCVTLFSALRRSSGRAGGALARQASRSGIQVSRSWEKRRNRETWIPPAGRSLSQMQERKTPSAGEGPALAPDGARPG